MDALQNFFFWTWKVGNSTRLGTSSSPQWHYRLGLRQGWIPKGTCRSIQNYHPSAVALFVGMQILEKLLVFVLASEQDRIHLMVFILLQLLAE